MVSPQIAYLPVDPAGLYCFLWVGSSQRLSFKHGGTDDVYFDQEPQFFSGGGGGGGV